MHWRHIKWSHKEVFSIDLWENCLLSISLWSTSMKYYHHWVNKTKIHFKCRALDNVSVFSLLWPHVIATRTLVIVGWGWESDGIGILPTLHMKLQYLLTKVLWLGSKAGEWWVGGFTRLLWLFLKHHSLRKWKESVSYLLQYPSL